MCNCAQVVASVLMVTNACEMCGHGCVVIDDIYASVVIVHDDVLGWVVGVRVAFVATLGVIFVAYRQLLIIAGFMCQHLNTQSLRLCGVCRQVCQNVMLN